MHKVVFFFIAKLHGGSRTNKLTLRPVFTERELDIFQSLNLHNVGP